jgi:hypothetical protein
MSVSWWEVAERDAIRNQYGQQSFRPELMRRRRADPALADAQNFW